MKALIIGCYPDLTVAPIPLLSRAGFKVDVLWHQEGHADIKNKSLIHKLYRCDTLKELPYLAASTHQSNKYDLVVIGCELALKEVLHSSLNEQEKLSLLPVVAIENYTHLSSKIGFSKLLSSANISTPEFQVIASQAGLISASKKFGYPFFIKIDWSGGGSGVFECDSSDDILKIIENLVFPVLMQRKIEGNTICPLGDAAA